MEITGSMKIDYDGETHHDAYVANTYQAMQITLKRTDVEIGGESPNAGDNPEIRITLPKVSYTTWTPDRPIDDIVSQDIEFMAHFDDDASKAIEVVVINEIASYA